jgi:hypothetical protein
MSHLSENRKPGNSRDITSHAHFLVVRICTDILAYSDILALITDTDEAKNELLSFL